ncbi:MAG TPA: hypothetical protein VF489_07965 [Sphingobium sp.]
MSADMGARRGGRKHPVHVVRGRQSAVRRGATPPGAVERRVIEWVTGFKPVPL